MNIIDRNCMETSEVETDNNFCKGIILVKPNKKRRANWGLFCIASPLNPFDSLQSCISFCEKSLQLQLKHWKFVHAYLLRIKIKLYIVFTFKEFYILQDYVL